MQKELVYRPDVLLLHHFTSILDLNFNHTEIREAIKSQKGFRTLQDISIILCSMGIRVGIYKVAISKIRKLSNPFLTVFNDSGTQFYANVKNISKNSITYYTPNQGTISTSIDSINNLWTGIILYPETIETKIFNIEDIEKREAEEYLSTNVKLIDNFFSNEECDFIRNYVEENDLFQRSPLAGTDGKIFYSNFRTSYTSIIKDKENTTLKSIYERVAFFLRVPQNYIEYLECVRYSPGQQFRPHWDTDKSEDRTHTLLLYLNDDFEGGETYFPQLNFKAKPQKGRVLYFKDRDEEQNIIPYSLHAGLPVNNGIKYACNIWVRNSPIPEKHYLETGVLA